MVLCGFTTVSFPVPLFPGLKLQVVRFHWDGVLWIVSHGFTNYSPDQKVTFVFLVHRFGCKFGQLFERSRHNWIWMPMINVCLNFAFFRTVSNYEFSKPSIYVITFWFVRRCFKVVIMCVSINIHIHKYLPMLWKVPTYVFCKQLKLQIYI